MDYLSPASTEVVGGFALPSYEAMVEKISPEQLWIKEQIQVAPAIPGLEAVTFEDVDENLPDRPLHGPSKSYKYHDYVHWLSIQNLLCAEETASMVEDYERQSGYNIGSTEKGIYALVLAPEKFAGIRLKKRFGILDWSSNVHGDALSNIHITGVCPADGYGFRLILACHDGQTIPLDTAEWDICEGCYYFPLVRSTPGVVRSDQRGYLPYCLEGRYQLQCYTNDEPLAALPMAAQVELEAIYLQTQPRRLFLALCFDNGVVAFRMGQSLMTERGGERLFACLQLRGALVTEEGQEPKWGYSFTAKIKAVA